MKKWYGKLMVLIVLFTGVLYAATAVAADEQPSGTVSISTTSIAIGIGTQWGSGVLLFKGKQHNFDVRGLSIIDVGVTTISAHGDVYHLNKIEDFAGTYTAVEAAGALAGGGGAAAMKNQKGVVMKIKSTQQGLKFKLAPEGLTVKMR